MRLAAQKKQYYNVSLWRENEHWRQKEKSFPFLIPCFESILNHNFAAGYVSATPDKNVYFLSMQRLATRAEQFLNKSLAAMQEDARLGQEETRLFAKEFIGAVYVANKNGQVVHGDLKPGNVMMTKERKVVIIDWGLEHMRGMNYVSSKKQHSQAPGKVQVQNRVLPALHNFPVMVKTVEKLGNGTPGYHRIFTPDQ